MVTPYNPISVGVWNPLNPDFMAGLPGPPPQLFPNSFWTRKIPANPTLAGNSATLVTNLVNGIASQGGTLSGYNGASRYVVHGQQIPNWTTVQVNPGNRWAGSPQGSLLVPLPPVVQPGQPGDYQVTVWDVDASQPAGSSYIGPLAYSFWTFNPTNTCNTMQRMPTDGINYTTGWGNWAADPSGLNSTTAAAGDPYHGGIITYADFLYGSINHALRMTVGNSTGTPVLPATASDGSTPIGSGGIPEGTCFFMPQSVAMPTFTGHSNKLAQMVFVALQQYGAYVDDQTGGGGFGISVENVIPWQYYQNQNADGIHWPLNTNFNYDAFNGMPWSSMQVLNPV